MTDADTFTRAALLRCVIEAPDDDTPRLIFADWLEEHGEGARAEFVRVQCRIAEIQRMCWCGSCVKRRGGGQHHNGPCGVDQERVTLPDGSSRQAFLRRRERELLDTHHRDWFQIFGLSAAGFGESHELCWWPAGDSRGQSRVMEGSTRRGFVAHVSLTATDWLTHAPAITAAHPIEEVTFTEFRTADGNALCWQWMKAMGRHPLREGVVGQTTRTMLADLWPRVKTWHLPTG
jgi:uncharacterized protein (TIGR02996 family)